MKCTKIEEGEILSTLKKIRHYLEEQQLDSMIITSPYNRRYISKFTGSAGFVIITPNEALLITDFRYVEQAEKQAKEFTIIEHKADAIEEINVQLTRLQVERLAFEAEHMTVAEFRHYETKLQCELVATKGVIEQFRMFKTAEEIAILKDAAKIADDAFEHILSYIHPGVREIDVANELEYFMRKQGATSSSFDIIVASGVRSSLPHGIASEKVITSGELVTLDFGAIYNGYCSDITRTVAVGDISDQLTEIYKVVLTAQEKAVAAIKPNMTGIEADAIARDYITASGYGDYFGHGTGHGLGLEVHEEPRLSPRSQAQLEVGMVVTVEPGIYIPNLGGCRIEDDIVLTETGNERLTLATKELIHL